MAIVLNWRESDDDVTLDQSGVAVLMVAPGVDLAEQRLASAVVELARRQDLVIVCGADGLDNGYPTSFALTKRLRDMLPRRTVVAVLVSDHPDAARHEFDTIATLVHNSAVTVAIAPAEDQLPVTVQLGRHLQTRTVLRLDRDGYRPVPPANRPGGTRS